jgi:hypothetical protein
VTLDVAYRVLDACSDAEWRLLFALSRFGGMRCPSEHLGLKWTDVDWGKNRFLVHSPKTEHHEDGGDRWVPIFPELRPYLEEAFDLAEPGAVYVITRHRDTRVNLRTQLLRIIKKAGLAPWPKPFQNLRASRETELAAVYPIHVVGKWIGNTAAVAQKHYLQVPEEYFERAANANSAPHSAPTAHLAAQHPAAPSRTETPEKQKTLEGSRVLRDGAASCETVPHLQGSPSRTRTYNKPVNRRAGSPAEKCRKPRNSCILRMSDSNCKCLRVVL